MMIKTFALSTYTFDLMTDNVLYNKELLTLIMDADIIYDDGIILKYCKDNIDDMLIRSITIDFNLRFNGIYLRYSSYEFDGRSDFIFKKHKVNITCLYGYTKIVNMLTD